MNPLLTKQVRSSFPHIQIPTSAQSALIPAILSPNDVLLRAHTGTGKSFALLLSLLAKPRLVFRDSPTSNSNSSSKKPINGISSILIVPTNELAFQYYQWSKKILPSNLHSSIDSVVQLLIKPDGTLFNLPEGIEKGKKGQREMLMKSLEKLRDLPPHLLIITPGRLKDLLELSSASEPSTLDPVSILNLKSLKTLAFDEGDQLLNLPGRFPSKKLTFKNASPFTSNLNHKSPTLSFLNLMMSLRPSFSGGSLLSSAGMEPSNWSRMGDEKRPPEKIRRIQHKGIDKRIEKLNHDNEISDLSSNLLPGGFSIPLERTGDSSSLSISNSLQLVFISATANAVLRHFLGSRTGWLRTGIKELSKDGKKVESGKWIDLTGLSGFERMKGMKENDEKQQMLNERWRENKDEPTSLPRELDHSCLVVDDGLDLENGRKGVEMDGDSISGSERAFKIPLIRNLDFKRLHRLTREEQEFYSKDQDQDQEETSSSKSRRNLSSSRKEPKELSERTVESSSLEEHIIDDSLLNALAFTFASDVVSNGLAVIPPRWSLLTSRQKLEQLGVPVRFIGEQEESKNEEDETRLTLIQSTSARGLDLPNLTHVFILGLDSVGDAVRYTHLAGRVSRIGHHQTITSETESQANVFSDSLIRPGGKVVTLIKGPSREFLDREIGNDTLSNIKYYDESSKKRRDLGLELIPIGNDEKKMSLIYRRLRLRPQRFDLSLLKSRVEVKGQRDSDGASE